MGGYTKPLSLTYTDVMCKVTEYVVDVVVRLGLISLRPLEESLVWFPNTTLMMPKELSIKFSISVIVEGMP